VGQNRHHFNQCILYHRHKGSSTNHFSKVTVGNGFAFLPVTHGASRYINQEEKERLEKLLNI
ncbi:MAG: hypothetical protein KAT05_00665, partial [Spirochaetes bacterium]|nr:hypothetical protein [Spirochaetota bacterium]